MEGSSEENLNGATDSADGSAALVPKKRSSFGIVFAVVALFVVVGLIFRARGSKKRVERAIPSLDDLLPPAEIPPTEPPSPTHVAEASGDEPSRESHESHGAPQPESVSANGFHEFGEHG